MNEFEAKLDTLIERLRAGAATKEEIAEMERLLQGDAQLRKRYRSRMRMEAHLFDTFQHHQPEMRPFDPEPATRSRWRLQAKQLLALAASVVLLGMLSVALWQPNGPRSVAEIDSMSGAAWEGTLNLVKGSQLAPGVLRLKAGMATIRFASGALVALEAPAEFEIESAMRTRLSSGKALVEAPPSAHGFIMSTPHGFITDHGTRFSVSVDELRGKAECEVLEGEISLHHEGSGKVKHLLDQEASVLEAAGIRKLDLLPSTFVQRPMVPFIRLGTGGKETSVVRSNLRGELLDDRMLMVKKSYQGKSRMADRRALFSIGLREVDPSSIDRINLRLNLVPSGLGFAAYMPESVRFTVYGVIDESREDWSLSELQWEEAPGYLASQGYQLDSNETMALGTFQLSRGQQRGSITFSSEKLTEFVRNDTTGECSFIIVRETPGQQNFSLVHAFASEQHPEARGPALEVYLK
ncbi:MAG: FecR family protein [Verrucomicrobiota bacterium]